ncbi:unnamed protein product [Ectocarpus sp. CCAP 1310/34]|nr:unnamed protein product [Ectocarpus sp. CCAP 1310/34]
MAHPWRDAAIATGLISSVPTMVLPFIPESATKPGSAVQRILLCFAVGGMMGDVFLHLLPHLLTGHMCKRPAGEERSLRIVPYGHPDVCL